MNPRETEVLGERAYASLADIPRAVDIVNVFRRPEDTPALPTRPWRSGPRRSGCRQGSRTRRRPDEREAGGLTVVMDACMPGVHAVEGSGEDGQGLRTQNARRASSSSVTSVSSWSTTARTVSGLLRSTPACCSSAIG